MAEQEDAGVHAPHLFMLTKITGRRRNEGRTKIVGTFEMGRRRYQLALWGLIPTVAITGLAALIVGTYAIFVAAAVMGGWFLLVERRTSTGLRTHTWSALLDRRRSLAGKFIQCGQVLTGQPVPQLRIVGASVPLVRARASDDATLLLAGESATPVAGEHALLAPTTPAKPGRGKGDAISLTPEPATSAPFELDDILGDGR